MSSFCLCHSHSNSNRQLGIYLFFIFFLLGLAFTKLKVYRSHSIAEKQIRMQNLKGFISHLRDHAAQSNEDIIRHSRTLNELRQHLRAAEDNLEHIKEEDANVQLKKKQSRDQLRQLRTELEQAHNKHSVAQYINKQHDTRLQMALGLESEMAKDRPQTPPARRDRQRAGQDGNGVFRLRGRARYI